MASKRRSSYGSVYRKTRSDGSHYDGWYARFVEAGRRVERWAGRNKEQAEAFLAARQLEKVRAQLDGVPEVRRVPFDEYVEDARKWFKANLRPSGLSARMCALDRAKEYFKRRDVLEIRTRDIQSFLEHLRSTRKYAVSTLHHVHRVMSSLFRRAIADGVARVNPCRGVELPKIDEEARPYYTPEELRRVYAAMPPDIRPIVVLMGEAGLRRNEAVLLRWDEVAPDFSRLILKGARTKGHRFRDMPLTSLAAETLREVHARRGTISMRGGDRVFTTGATDVNARFRLAADKAGFPELTPHGLRHAFASGLVRAGVDLPTVARLLGHRDIKTTMKYANHAPSDASVIAIRALEASRAHPARAAGSEPR